MKTLNEIIVAAVSLLLMASCSGGGKSPKLIKTEEIQDKWGYELVIVATYADSTELAFALRDENSQEVTVIDGFAPNGVVVVPEKITSNKVTYKVTQIDEETFTGSDVIKEVIIPNTITEIVDGAFEGCEKLEHVIIPNSVTSIGVSAFEDCTSLTSITIPNSVTSIGEKAFSGCESLTSIAIPEGVKSIGENAFAYSGLTSISIPQSVMSIGERAFGCPKLNSIIVSENNIKYDSRENCNAIIETETASLIQGCKSTVIPNSVTHIGEYAFSYTGLTSINIPSNFTIIDETSFAYCKDLVTINIPNSITSIGAEAFRGCTGLKSVTIPNSVKSIKPWAFEGCSGLTSITIPNSVTDIESWAFSDCSSLESVTIPNGVKIIGIDAFSYCRSLSSITIPSSVECIGEGAFKYCTELSFASIPNDMEMATISKVSAAGNKYSFVRFDFDEVFRGCEKLQPWNVVYQTSGNEVSAYQGNSYSAPSQSVSTGQVVVIDGSELRLRLGPSTSSDTFKWPDGKNRHPNVGDRFKYLGESGDFYKIDFNGNELWVSKQFSHIEESSTNTNPQSSDPQPAPQSISTETTTGKSKAQAVTKYTEVSCIKVSGNAWFVLDHQYSDGETIHIERATFGLYGATGNETKHQQLLSGGDGELLRIGQRSMYETSYGYVYFNLGQKLNTEYEYQYGYVTSKADGYVLNKADVVLSPSNLYINRKLITSYSTRHLNLSTNMCLFANNKKGDDVVHNQTATLGTITITNNQGKVTAKYTPVLDSYGRPCFYNTISGSFIYHTGSGTPDYEP